MHNFSINEVLDTAESNYGFRPDQFYCLLTGKPIGVINSNDLDELVYYSLGDDLESIADDLALRALASCRPSMRWNRMRMETIEQMMKLAPRETMAYLLNRLFESNAEKAPSLITQIQFRIKLWKVLVDLPKSDLESLILYQLLEIDAKLGLKEESPPFKCSDLLRHADNFWKFLSDSLDPWHEQRIEAWQKAEREAKFFNANPGARRAYAKAFFESKPKSEAQIKREEKQSDLNLMAAVLQELMGNVPDSKPSAQRVKLEPMRKIELPSTKMPMRFGVKKPVVEGES